MSDRLPTTVVPSRHDVRLEPDLEAATFTGEETITVTVREPVREIVLNAAELAIHPVTIRDAEGGVVQGAARLDEAAEQARLVFPGRLEPGEWRLTLGFAGTLNDRLRGFSTSIPAGGSVDTRGAWRAAGRCSRVAGVGGWRECAGGAGEGADERRVGAGAGRGRRGGAGGRAGGSARLPCSRSAVRVAAPPGAPGACEPIRARPARGGLRPGGAAGDPRPPEGLPGRQSVHDVGVQVRDQHGAGRRAARGLEARLPRRAARPGRGPAWLAEAEAVHGDPERTARRAEAWAAIREVIEHDLTDRQRQALKAIVADGVPLDELVRHWGSNRNAAYKLLHDARRKLKSRLEARGFAPRDVLALFSGPG